MPAEADGERLFEQLRLRAAAAPRDARAEIAALMDAADARFETVLRMAGTPGEGRLRQIIAHAVQRRSDKARVVAHLIRWRDSETDEFAKAAIVGALENVDFETYRAQGLNPPKPALPDFVETYRYVAGRLCHRVRNGLSDPVRYLRQIEDWMLETNRDTGSLREIVQKLKKSLQVVGRVVEFETDERWFAWQTVDLCAWLRDMEARYAAREGGLLPVRIEGILAEQPICVRAAPVHLETLFWNVWKNAQQAVSEPCQITIRSEVRTGQIELLLLDNGEGFAKDDAELAFRSYFPGTGQRGRGLLEVHDAVLQLGGVATVRYFVEHGWRILLSFPVVVPNELPTSNPQPDNRG